MPTEGAPHPSGFWISERERLDRVERASPVYAVVVSFAPESSLLRLCDQTAGVDPNRPFGRSLVFFNGQKRDAPCPGTVIVTRLTRTDIGGRRIPTITGRATPPEPRPGATQRNK